MRPSRVESPVHGRYTLRRIAAGTAFALAGAVIGRVLGMVMVLAMARSLGPAGFGLYSFVTVFAGMFMVLADLGLYQVLVRETAAGRVDPTVLIGHGLILRLILGCLAWLALVLVA